MTCRSSSSRFRASTRPRRCRPRSRSAASLPGIDRIEILVVDDGSRDGTAEVARANGVQHIVRFRRRKGLAAAFVAGIDASLKLGADFIVNTDADNQYDGGDIAKLIAPLVRGDADIVIGDRNIQALAAHESAEEAAAAPRQLGRPTGVGHPGAGHDQRLSRLHARGGAADDDRLGVLVHARVDHPGRQGRGWPSPTCRSARIRGSARHGCSTASGRYIKVSSATIVRIYAMYEPLKGVLVHRRDDRSLVGAALVVRFLFYYFTGAGRGHVQSLILGGADDRRLSGPAHRAASPTSSRPTGSCSKISCIACD